MVNWRAILAKITQSDRETVDLSPLSGMYYQDKFSQALLVTGDPSSIPVCPDTYDDTLDTLKIQ